MKKKLLTIIISLAAAFCLCFGLAACAGVGTEGTYYLIENDKYVKETYFTLQGGKWTDDDGVSGEYEINGDAITLYTDLFGTKMEFTSGTVKDGVLTLKGIYGDKVYAQEGAWKGASGGNQGGNQGGSPSAKEYSVTYDANGGTFSGGQNTYTQTVKEGNKLTAPTSPTRKNYTFAGWAKSKNGSAMWKFDEDTVSENITLYAQWTQESAVILSVDGASIEGREIFMLVDHTTVEVSLSNKVVCSDDSIWRLYSDPEGQREIPTKMVTNLKSGENVYYLVVNSQNQAQVNVYKFTVHRSYLVTISYYNGETLLETAETYTGNTFTASYKPNITGYTFNKWKTASGKEFTSDVLWSSLALYADKTANTYKATLDVSGGDALSETEKTMTYDSSYSFPVPRRTGYSFTGWYVGSTQVTNANGSSLSAWKYASAQKVTAHWKANDYAVTLKQNDSEAGTVTGGGDHAYDSQVTIKATTNNGYTFLGWFKDGEKQSSDLTYQFKMGFSATYSAQWIKCPVTLAADLAEGGTVSGVEKTVAGAQTTITAKTNKGYTWLGWYNGDTELTRDLTYTFPMPSNEQEHFIYTARWIKVSIEMNNAQAGSVIGLDREFVVGEEVTITAATNVEFIWMGWYDGAELLSDAVNYTFDMPSESKNWTARWGVNYIDSNGDVSIYTEDDIQVIKNINSRTLTGWYVFSGTVSGNCILEISGVAHVILADNCDWIIGSGGIHIINENELHIYAQSVSENVGKLTVNGNIGGNNGENGGVDRYGGATNGGNGEDCGIIVFNGGIITASFIGGGNGGHGANSNLTGGYAGGSGGHGGNAGTIIINGGIISATKIGGGNGGDGGMGTQGTTGRIISGNTFYPTTQGGNGGKGGNGGNAGVIIINNGSLTVTSIYGGNGGNGKNGARGGNGATSGSIDNGNAGHIIIYNGIVVISNIYYGTGGTGGTGGVGGNAGRYPSGAPTSNGSTGSNGRRGDGGSRAMIYYNGSKTKWGDEKINSTYADIYFYSGVAPTEEQWEDSPNWWYYDDDTGEIVIWKKPE